MSKKSPLLLFAGIFLLNFSLLAENIAVRDLPDTYIPGSTFNVTISITIYPETPVTGFIITEYLPQGWAITNASPYWSSYIGKTNSYKWLYFFQFPVYGEFTITYTVRVPVDASGTHNFSGTINDQYSVRDIGGDTSISQHAMVAAPVFSQQSQTFYNFFPDIEISCDTFGATIYYTTDGSDPDQNSTAYSIPMHLTQSTTIKARAYKSGYSPSSIASAQYTIQINKGDINKDTSVDISDVILCLRMAINLNQPDIQKADIDKDGFIDISDVILILRISIGLL